jgi:hypothetical protein
MYQACIQIMVASAEQIQMVISDNTCSWFNVVWSIAVHLHLFTGTRQGIQETEIIDYYKTIQILKSCT